MVPKYIAHSSLPNKRNLSCLIFILKDFFQVSLKHEPFLFSLFIILFTFIIGLVDLYFSD